MLYNDYKNLTIYLIITIVIVIFTLIGVVRILVFKMIPLWISLWRRRLLWIYKKEEKDCLQVSFDLHRILL